MGEHKSSGTVHKNELFINENCTHGGDAGRGEQYHFTCWWVPLRALPEIYLGASLVEISKYSTVDSDVTHANYR